MNSSNDSIIKFKEKEEDPIEFLKLLEKSDSIEEVKEKEPLEKEKDFIEFLKFLVEKGLIKEEYKSVFNELYNLCVKKGFVHNEYIESHYFYDLSSENNNKKLMSDEKKFNEYEFMNQTKVKELLSGKCDIIDFLKEDYIYPSEKDIQYDIDKYTTDKYLLGKNKNLSQINKSSFESCSENKDESCSENKELVLNFNSKSFNDDLAFAEYIIQLLTNIKDSEDIKGFEDACFSVKWEFGESYYYPKKTIIERGFYRSPQYEIFKNIIQKLFLIEKEMSHVIEEMFNIVSFCNSECKSLILNLTDTEKYNKINEKINSIDEKINSIDEIRGFLKTENLVQEAEKLLQEKRVEIGNFLSENFNEEIKDFNEEQKEVFFYKNKELLEKEYEIKEKFKECISDLNELSMNTESLWFKNVFREYIERIKHFSKLFFDLFKKNEKN